MPKWTIEEMPDQNGRIAIVTGANSGLGYETTLALARKGAQVITACRNLEKGRLRWNRCSSRRRTPCSNS